MIEIRIDSLFQFATPYFDEEQEEYVWGISDVPPVKEQDDDKFYTVKSEDRIDLIAYRFYKKVRYWWIIAHYNNISNPLDLSDFVGRDLRIPSKSTVERDYINATSTS